MTLRFPPGPWSGSGDQLELFPQRVEVERLDPRSVVGRHTRVRAVYTVRFEREGWTHQIFLDRHGWYCADHGPRCAAVREVTTRLTAHGGR